MAVTSSRGIVLISTLVVMLGLVGGYWWMNRGYGEVSRKTYEFSKALYSACLNKNEVHLNKVEQLVNQTDEETLPSNERAWLVQIIERARSGKWESAAKKAKRMMEDQVEY